MKRTIATIVILLVTAVVHVAIQTQYSAAADGPREESTITFPETVGTFEQAGQDIDPGDSVRETLQTSDIIMRQYRSPGGWPVFLTIVLAGQTRGSLHFPEVCLVGQGWEIHRQYAAPVGFLFSSKRLVLTKGNRNEAVLYWFKTGDEFTGSYFFNTCLWAVSKLRMQSAASSMIKLSTPIGPQGEEAAFALLERFAEELAPVVRERIP